MQITLYTLGGAFGMRNVSPFCFKVEMLLTQLGIPFEMVEEPDPRQAPKGKLPYVKIDGEVIADSDLITRKLDALTQGRVFGDLTPEQRGIGLGLTRLAEEHLYWILVASRWLDDAWWPNVVDGFFHIAPSFIRPFIAGRARKGMRQTYDLQGLGRHTQSEQEQFARDDLAALENAVGEHGFLFGDTPSYFDFAIAAILTGIYDNRPKTWLTPIAEEYKTLHQYVLRVQESVGLYAAEQASQAS